MTQTLELPQVVKDYIRDLPKEKQDRLLTGRFVHCGKLWHPGSEDATTEGCLIQLAEGSLRAPYLVSYGAPADAASIRMAFDMFASKMDRGIYADSRRQIPNTAAIVRDYVLELRAEEIVGSGNASVPVERRWVPQVVAIGLSLLMVFV